MPKKNTWSIELITALTDCIALAAAFYTAYAIRFLGFLPVKHLPDLLEYATSLFLIIPVYLFVFRQCHLYQANRYIRRIEEIFQVLKACSIAILLLLAIAFFYRGVSYSRITLLLLWGLSMFFVSASRYVMIEWEYRRKLKPSEVSRLLIIGASNTARSIIQWTKNHRHYGKQVVAVLAKNPELVGKHIEGISIIGTVDHYEKAIETTKPDEVILLDSSFTRERIPELVVDCEDKMIAFKVAADFYGLMSQNVDVEYLSTVPLVGFRELPLDDAANRFVKRAFDLAGALLILILTLPFWIVLAILIKLEDGGPIFYAQDRVGRDQTVFKVLKFRTMKVNAEKDTGPVWATADDKRRTSLGNFLRRWNIDELPQLLNVIKAEMSLVGPRPERPHFVNQFRETIPRYMARHKIKSGLTGWAQVNGFRGNTSIVERTKYDLYYAENWSLLFDLEILVMTLFAFKNAY